MLSCHTHHTSDIRHRTSHNIAYIIRHLDFLTLQVFSHVAVLTLYQKRVIVRTDVALIHSIQLCFIPSSEPITVFVPISTVLL
mmetsp:Transcript_2644/g.7343  ORF Transcript_2644/g.7343 Transcript_2644/m.7343 type:complete len:83 (-) Transcript_2644:1459-1707(-)